MPHGKPIRGQTPYDDRSGLIDKFLITREEIDQAEFANISKVTLKYLSKTPSARVASFDFSWMKRLHGEMFRDVWRWAGKFRLKPMNIGVSPERIETLLYDLSLNFPLWSSRGCLEQAVELHHQAVYIHPFRNGNGRWSRMLADIWLKRNGLEPIAWPAEVGRESPIREGYLAALRQADAGDLSPLIELFRTYSVRQY